MSYPFVRFWQRKARDSLVSCVRHAIRYGNEDWHQGDVVLIRKADKPRYDVVKGWRIIHLLPVLAKVSERMVLLEVAKHVELESTQFGSRRGRGTHDACAAIYEFLRAHEGYVTALLSMDVEGGFDKIDIDLLADFLSARACPPALVGWIRHWASQRKIRFKFNGRLSKVYCLGRGIPQGSPLSPFLFGTYVADIFRPRLQYSPSVRSACFSYVDDGVVAVAGESVLAVRNRLEEVFEDCSRVARGRHMGFSGLKTKVIGFGAHDWGVCTLDGVEVSFVDELRILGMRFAVDGKMGKHVDYWLDRGLQVRGRIGAISRRFGGSGGIGAWEVMRLVQGAFLPVVEYGLEFVAEDPAMVKRIEVHVRDCLRSLFRMPQRLANNILHSECGIPPTSIRADYLRARLAQRFLDYGYCKEFPWTGSVRNAWLLDGMVATRMSSDVVFVTGRGGAGFHSPDPALTRGRGGMFRVIPTPPPSGAHPHSFPERGPVCYHLFLTGTRLGYGWGGGLSGRQGQGMPKKTPRPRPLSGAGRGKQPGARVFRGPVRPVTNSNQMRYSLRGLGVLSRLIRSLVNRKVDG